MLCECIMFYGQTKSAVNVSYLFCFPRKANLLGHYPKLKLSWNARIKIVNFCGKWQLFSYKFDQPCFSIFYSFLKCAASSNICISHNITWNQTAQVFGGTPGTHSFLQTNKQPNMCWRGDIGHSSLSDKIWWVYSLQNSRWSKSFTVWYFYWQMNNGFL
jgi:hypothetical protein